MRNGNRRGRRFLRPQRPTCWMDKRSIRGKVVYWHHHPVCKRCYKHLCQEFRVVRPTLPRQAVPTQSKSLLARIFGL